MSTLPPTKQTAKPQTGGDFLARPEFAEVSRQVRHAPPRYRNEIGKFSVFRSSACVECGKCVKLCPHGVHQSPAGFGPLTDGLMIDCYDNPGDYLGSGMDGLEVHVHGNAQDQLCQVTKRGKLVVHGDVGQTFLLRCQGARFLRPG